MPPRDIFFFLLLSFVFLIVCYLHSKLLPKMAHGFWNLGLVFLAYHLWSLDFFALLALSLVLAGLCLPLLFLWDQSRNFSWSGHYVLFVLQTLALTLSPLAFYRGLQGPLPLSEVSCWTQGRQALLILAYLAMLLYQCWPAQWALPQWLRARLHLQPQQPYVYGQELYRWLESFPERRWCQIWDQGLHALLNQDQDLWVHRSLDFFCMVFCPLVFLALALWGLLVERDLRWMLLAQPLQLLAFLYGQNQLLLRAALEDNKAFLETFLRLEIQQPSEAGPVALVFHWQPGQADLGPGKLQYYGRLWLSLGQLCQRWHAWLRPSGLLNPQNSRGLATRAYAIKKQYQKDLVELTKGEYAQGHFVGLNDSDKLDGNFTTEAQKRPNGIVIDESTNLKGQEKPQGFLVYGKIYEVPWSWLKYLPGSKEYLAEGPRRQSMDQGLRDKGPGEPPSE